MGAAQPRRDAGRRGEPFCHGVILFPKKGKEVPG